MEPGPGAAWRRLVPRTSARPPVTVLCANRAGALAFRIQVRDAIRPHGRQRLDTVKST
jgi:hypothetical protein